MEENKDATAEGGLRVESKPGAAHKTGPAVGAKVQCKPGTDSGLLRSGGQSAKDNPRAEDGLRAVSKPDADSGRIAAGRLRTKGRQSAESRFRVASGLHAHNGTWMAGTDAPCCDQCKQPILRLETYITVGDVTLCDGCYMNMGTGEFLSKIGGELRVME